MYLLRLLDEVGISYERRMLYTTEVHTDTVAPSRPTQRSKKNLRIVAMNDCLTGNHTFSNFYSAVCDCRNNVVTSNNQTNRTS